MNLDQNVQLLIDYFGSCERIHKTPLPFVYVVHLRRALVLYCFTLPFALVDPYGWWAIPQRCWSPTRSSGSRRSASRSRIRLKPMKTTFPGAILRHDRARPARTLQQFGRPPRHPVGGASRLIPWRRPDDSQSPPTNRYQTILLLSCMDLRLPRRDRGVHAQPRDDQPLRPRDPRGAQRLRSYL